MSLILQSSGGGQITIQEPTTASTFTQTLPAVTGTIITTGNRPAGSVLQVVTVNKTDTFSMASATWTDVTGLSLSITPSSTSNKILISASIALSSSSDFSYIRLLRNSTVIDVGDAVGSRPQVTGAASYPAASPQYMLFQIPVTYLDSPATTSAVTYKFQLRNGTTGSTAYINRTSSDRDTADYEWRTPSNIVLMEIAA